MDELHEKTLTTKIIEILDNIFYLRANGGGFFGEIFADYRDNMENATAGEILENDDPESSLYEKLLEWYGDVEWAYKLEVIKEVKRKLGNDKEAFPDGIHPDTEEAIDDFVRDHVWFDYPEKHFLDQKFYVNIMLDTGDGNYDFTLNSPYPCWCGDYDTRLNEKSSLLWLARQQGYNKTQLWRALREGDMRDPKGFLQSCRVECANLPSHMATVTFLVRMNLANLIALNRCIKLQDRNGHHYDATKNPYCGYITLDKDTMCGLFDPWNGGGSVLEIQLERDVKIPIRYIWSALPDGCGHGRYGVDSVYGMCSSAWKDSLKEIRIPKLKAAS